MSADDDLRAALETLRKRVARKKPRLVHHDARAVLVALGSLALDEPADVAERAADDVRAVVAGCAAAWDDVVQRELSLACTEHVQGVDPRYLDLPNYDFAYTAAARERLEARLRAAELLGLEVPAHLLAQVEEADGRLEPYLRRQDG